MAKNFIPNAKFSAGARGGLPNEWDTWAARPVLMPQFKLATLDGERMLLAAGNGSDDCVGHIAAPVTLIGGRTYRMRVRFKISKGMDPHQNLLFCCYAGWREGIFRFRRLDDGWIEGDDRFRIPGDGPVDGNVRILFRLSARGKAWVQNISLVECAPVKPRPVRVTCTRGMAQKGLADWAKALDLSGRMGADLALLPETFNCAPGGTQTMKGPSAKLMASKAREHGMYVAGGVRTKDHAKDRVYNKTLLFGRKGRFAGEYTKNHPYSPELNDEGTTPGVDVPVFKTDFGKVGVMICYDSWFPDIAELLALRGAEIILFPNAGYYRALMPARAADNATRIVCSSSCNRPGIWDTLGRDVQTPDAVSDCGHPFGHDTFSDVAEKQVGPINVLAATLDLSRSPSPHHNGGSLMSAPGGRCNRREQKRLLYDDIRREVEHWW
jgi:predicted amidohydrolase